MIRIEVIHYHLSVPCDLCGSLHEGELLTVASWIGCCAGVEKEDTLVICHECASCIRNACWQMEANQTQRAKEDRDGSDDDNSSPSRVKAVGQEDS